MTDKDVARVLWRQMALGAMLLASTASGQAENKWVWSGNARSISAGEAPTYTRGEVGRPPYRPPAPVFETSDFNNPPPFLQPSRPIPRPPNTYRPIDVTRPGGPGILNGPDGPRPGGSGILTGPVPSWEQRPGDKFAYKDYEHCKCAYAFNCASPGIKFGHCDTEKQYCCYNTKPNFNGRPPANRGPGLVDTSVRPTYERPILIGPGGPTGIVTDGGRPFKPPGGPYRPLGREDFDEDYGPNGKPYLGYGTINDQRFPRPPYDPYERSANIEAKKNGKRL